MTRVVVAGAGVAAVEFALALRALAGERVAIELLAPAPELVQRPASIRTPFGHDPAPRVALEDLARELGLTLLRDTLAGVDPAAHDVLTRGGERVPYDLLFVAVGAHSREAVPGAVTFRGPLSAGAVEQVLARAADDPELRVAFTGPGGAAWPLPLYELALLSAATLRERGVPEPDLVVATFEAAPLERLGPAPADAVRAALDRHGIDVVTGAVPERALGGALQLRDGRLVDAAVVVALPEIVGPRIAGLPADDDGFIPVDDHGAVAGCPDVYAAGDATAGPIKHGGLTAQLADAAAEAVAARVGAIDAPQPYRPVLRALLFTGGDPLYLRADLDDPASTAVSTQPLWSPPVKVAGRYLAPFLATGTASGALLEDVAPQVRR